MPIYAYKCEACGFSKDVLQKLSDDPLAVCPSCGAAAFQKQLTAAGFQLKGSGWYVTDFRDGKSGAASADKAKSDESAVSSSSASTGKDGDAGSSKPATSSGNAEASGAAAPAPAPAPAASTPAPAPAAVRPSQP